MIAVWSVVVLAGLSALALRHGPSPKPVVLVPQGTTTIHCGDTITQSIVVANDLDCSLVDANGLNVNHANITINLNGHTLAGNNGSYGIWAHGFAAVTIANGTVSDWLYGVWADGPNDRVTGVRATANSHGIALTGADALATGNVAFKNSGDGILTQGNNDKVTANVVRENGAQGIVVNAAGVVVQTNQSLNNGSYGIQDVGTGTTLNVNVTNGNANDGILSAVDQTATVVSNTANYNGAYGIEASPGGKDGGGNLAKGNTTAAQCKDVVCS